MKKTALVLGATGLVGNYCLKALLKNEGYSRVAVIVRKPIKIADRKFEQIICPDFSMLNKFEFAFKVNDVFCCVGTTIKKAKSKAAFQAVDFDIPLIAAQLSARQKVSSFSLVSAIGADKRSSNFYLKTKGMMELAVEESGVVVLHIFRPSLIRGERKEYRRGEKIAGFLMLLFDKLIFGNFQKYKSIPAEEIAQSMVNAVQETKLGRKIFTFKEMKALLK